MTVHVRLMTGHNGTQIGILALSAPERINAQNLSMVRQICAALNDWRDQAQIVAVVMIGAGERGFCAGGDLKALHAAMTQPGELAQGDAFFAEEYLLCQMIRDYAKPVMAWGHGIVMGGGWGLFAAASHKVVTERSKLAMPETAIGLFPDVAASRWLNELAGFGPFLALSGVAINASDALYCGAAQWALPESSRHQVLMDLSALAWQGQPELDRTLLSAYLTQAAQQAALILPEGNLPAHQDLLHACASGSLSDALHHMSYFSTLDDAWLAAAALRVQRASPTSLWLAWTLQKRCAALSFVQTVQLETEVSAACLRYGDFAAGIYATLFDRNHSPVWQQSQANQLEVSNLAQAFPMLCN